MTRAILLTTAFAALLHFTDRVIAGLVECSAAQSCPNHFPASRSPEQFGRDTLAGGH